jgi:NarL family two-component system response regulator LiaR
MPPLSVVVVDDEPDYRQLVCFLLLSLPDVVTFVVGEAADGEEALALPLRVQPDIVITDLVMPGLNGVDLTRRVRQELPQTKIILMSSFT